MPEPWGYKAGDSVAAWALFQRVGRGRRLRRLPVVFWTHRDALLNQERDEVVRRVRVIITQTPWRREEPSR